MENISISPIGGMESHSMFFYAHFYSSLVISPCLVYDME